MIERFKEQDAAITMWITPIPIIDRAPNRTHARQ